jgi:kojibiose phosphorylase
MKQTKKASPEAQGTPVAQGHYEFNPKQKWVVSLAREDYLKRNHLLLIANGFVGVRSSFGELFTLADSSTHVIGIYDQVGFNDPNRDPWHPERDKWKEIINMPNFMLMGLKFDGEVIQLTEKNHADFRVALDMRTATLTLGYVWTSAKGRRVRVSHERFCTYTNRNLVWSEVTLTSLDAGGEFEVDTAINGKVTDAHGPHLENWSVGECEGGIWLSARTQQHQYEVGISSKHRVSGEGVKVQSAVTPGKQEIHQVLRFTAGKGKAVRVLSQHTLFTSRDAHDPLGQAQTATFNFDQEKKAHLAALKQHWDLSAVEIDGDDKAQHYLLYNLYILLISIPKDFDYASIPSRSLSAATYKGAIFWEVDTYAFPFYAYVFPDYARNLLLYRYKCLQYAIKKASDLGYDGAFFAWESLDTGEEATKKLIWQDIHSGRMMRNYFGDRQWHIAGDVIFAAWQYYAATGDWEFMSRYGAEMTLLTARFVGSLVYYKVPKDRYEVLHTVCPDEYHEEVDNNAFTNRILRFAVEKVFELIRLFEERDPARWAALKLQLKITDEELEYWQDIVAKMFIKEPAKNFVIEQHDGYFDLEDITLDEFKSRIIRDEYLGHTIGPAPLTQIVKQADVVQLLVMFKNEYHPIARKATFDYYDLRTEHGSGDSPNAYGIVAAQVGDRERGYYYFMRSARIDLESTNPKKKANFFLGGVHIAPSGGTWQVVSLGFAGIDVDPAKDTLRFNPCLPRHWTRVKFNFVFKGQVLAVELDQKTLSVLSHTDNQNPLHVQVGDAAVVEVQPGQKIAQTYRSTGRHALSY